jgi:hypothetical protein
MIHGDFFCRRICRLVDLQEEWLPLPDAFHHVGEVAVIAAEKTA